MKNLKSILDFFKSLFKKQKNLPPKKESYEEILKKCQAVFDEMTKPE